MPGRGGNARKEWENRLLKSGGIYYNGDRNCLKPGGKHHVGKAQTGSAGEVETKYSFKFHDVGDLQDKAIRGAIQQYAKEVAPGDVLMLMDTTLFSSGKEAFDRRGGCTAAFLRENRLCCPFRDWNGPGDLLYPEPSCAVPTGTAALKQCMLPFMRPISQMC